MSLAARLAVGLLLLAACDPARSQPTDPASLQLGPSQMFKLVVPQPLGSNRLEYDAILPFRETDSERYFLDAKGFVTEQPLVGTAPGEGLIQGYGQSARIGVRSLLDRGHAFRGVSLG